MEGKKNSFGIRILGRLYRIFSIIILFSVLFISPIYMISPRQISFMCTLIFLGIQSILLYIIGTSLLKLKSWALTLCITYSICSVLVVMHNISRTYNIIWHKTLYIIPILSILLFILSIYYLTRPKVVEQFSNKESGRMKLSFGMKTMAILCIFYPILAIYINILQIDIIKFVPEEHFLSKVSFYRIDSFSKVIVFLIVSIILFTGGIGILELKSWARKLLVWFFAINSTYYFLIEGFFFITPLLGLFFLALGYGYDHEHQFLKLCMQAFLYLLFHTVFSIILFYFFTRPKVNDQFKQ